MSSSKLRLPFWTAVGIGWLVVLLLLGEAALRLVQKSAMASNPFIVANEAKEPEFEFNTALNEDNLKRLQSFSVDLGETPCATGRPGADAPKLLADTAWLQDFAAANDARKQLLAVSNNLIAVEEKAGGPPVRGWGAWPLNAQEVVASPEHQNLPQTGVLDRLRNEIASGLNREMQIIMHTAGAALPAGSDSSNWILLAHSPWNPPQKVEEPDARFDLPWFTYAPNVTAMPVTGLMKSNGIGFYDDEVTLPKPSGTIRIVCVGGSTTNEGAEISTNYPNIIEAALRKALAANPLQGIKDVEVINCGVEGITSVGIYHRFEDYLALEPDLVLLLEGINDLMINTLQSPLLRPQSAFRRKAADWSALYHFLDPDALRPQPDRLRTAIQGTTIAYFEAFIERARGCGVPVAVCTVPVPDPDYLSPAATTYLDRTIEQNWHCPDTTYMDYHTGISILNEELLALAERQGCPAIPLDAYFTGVLGSLYIFYDICHMYPIGWSAKAQCSASYIAPLLPKLAKGAATAL